MQQIEQEIKQKIYKYNISKLKEYNRKLNNRLNRKYDIRKKEMK